MADIVIPLTKPIQAHGKELRELELREPTAGDILHVGSPVILDMASDPPRVTHDERKMSAMISRLASIPPSSQAQMDPRDWMRCAWELSPFFMPPQGTI